MKKPELSLVFFAAASLYLELAVIRFTAAEVIYLGYFSNFILISTFVGLGLGFLTLQKNISINKYIPFLLLFLFSLVLTAEFDVEILKNHFGLFYFGNIQKRAGLPGAFLLVILFLVTVLLFAGIGNRIANCFKRFQPLKAYTLDITGSLAGIGLFTLQCVISTGPVTWVFTGIMLLSLGYLADYSKAVSAEIGGILISGFCVIVLLLSSNGGIPTIWSMYQKLEVVENSGWGYKVIFANGIAHQIIDPVKNSRDRYYATPYKLKKDYDGVMDDVLIIGSGTGTDLAVALEYNVRNIDAVDIDGKIIELGIYHNPDKPYQDQRVNIIVDDGRHFLRNTDKKYDLIVFALPDSLMRVSAMSSVRLESYLFTRESFEDVKNHLKDSGMFVMYNQYRWHWLVNKLMASMKDVFGNKPLRMLDKDLRTTILATAPDLQGSSYKTDGFKQIATDDWPFIYMQKPGIHWLYIGMISMFLLVSFAGVWYLTPKGFISQPNIPYFFMGAAFLLLETKSLAFFSLLFGTTWFVNTLAFSGILISVLIANLIVGKFRIEKRLVLFICLFSSLLIMYFIPNSYFLKIESDTIRYLVSIMFAFSPIFFANLIFSREFRDSTESTIAFGWNLLGAVVGGGLEYLSLYMGFNNLILIVALFYMFVAISIRRIQPA